MATATTLNQEVCSFLHLRDEYEIGFRNEHVLGLKVGYFKQSCLTNCDKMLNFSIFENGDTYIQSSCMYYCKFCQFVYCQGKIYVCKKSSYVILGFEKHNKM